MVSPKGEIDQRPRRFYTDVTVAPEGTGWGVNLDARPLRTPEKHLLVLPTEALANVIADEWRAQAERIDLLSMYNTRLANVVLDRAPLTRAGLADEASRYTHTDLVCHLADNPAALRVRQEAAWAVARAPPAWDRPTVIRYRPSVVGWRQSTDVGYRTSVVGWRPSHIRRGRSSYVG